MKAFVFLLILSFGVSSYAQTQYTVMERLGLLFSGQQEKLDKYKSEMYQAKKQQAYKDMTSAYTSWLEFVKTNHPYYLNEALNYADHFNSNLRFMASNQKFGDHEELITLATIYRYEFFQDFKNFLQSPWVKHNLNFMEIANLHTIAYDFERVYYNDLEQPRDR